MSRGLGDVYKRQVDDFNIYIEGIEEMIDFFLDEDYDDEGYNSGESNSNGDIDLIFNR